MHVSLSPAGNGSADANEAAFSELMNDPVWQALQAGRLPLNLLPQYSEDDLKLLLDKLREHKMMEQLSDLLSHLPAESQQLLDRLQEAHLQQA